MSSLHLCEGQPQHTPTDKGHQAHSSVLQPHLGAGQQQGSALSQGCSPAGTVGSRDLEVTLLPQVFPFCFTLLGKITLATCHKKSRIVVLSCKYQAYGKDSQTACVGAEGADDRVEQCFWPSQAGYTSKFLSSFGPMS